MARATGTKTTATPPIPADGEITAELRAWISPRAKRADAGDRSALEELTGVYDALPALWTEVGNLQYNVELRLIDLFGGKDADNLLSRRGIRRRLDAMRQELLGSDPTPLDRMLVDRVIATWLMVMYADLAWAIGFRGSGLSTLADWVERRAAWAHRQHADAVRNLATVRRLLGPVVQVNIGEKQVNISGPALPAARPVKGKS